MAAADQEAAARKSSPASQRGFSFGGRLIKGRRKYSSIRAKTRKELSYKRRFAAKNRPDFLNPIWRTVEKINRAGKNPAHAQVVT